ncbi:hypothetical protein JCM24511_06081 [Saitozyma sp. JCM 24511]|nr:hypothetical protein JCM24511_06081 [Saitozyma sp. JCM 24511]
MPSSRRTRSSLLTPPRRPGPSSWIDGLPAQTAAQPPSSQLAYPQSQYHSQSQSQSQSQSHPIPPSQEPLSLASVSTATLPPLYTVTLAVPPCDVPLDPSASHAAFVRGEEALSDGWRRDVGLEGRLVDLRKRYRTHAIGFTAIESSRKGKGKDKGKEKVTAYGQGSVEEDVTGHASVLTSGEHDTEQRALWYTADLRFPCSCELSSRSDTLTDPPSPSPSNELTSAGTLASLKRAFKPRYLPPTSHALHPLPPHPDPSQIPLTGSSLPEWAPWIPVDPSRDGGRSLAELDLDPGLDEIAEFEPLWRDADGGWGRGWSCDGLEDEVGGGKRALGHVDGGAQPSVAEPKAATAGSDRGRNREGKRLVGRNENGLGPTPTLVDLQPPLRLPTKPLAMARGAEGGDDLMARTIIHPPPDGGDDHALEVSRRSFAPESDKQAWAEESERRKSYWRRMMRSDESYGRIWSILPSPHSLSPLPRPKSKSTKPPLRPPDYILPSALSALSSPIAHPYHPDLAGYIGSNPTARVYWLIPVHGPVLLPGWNDPADLRETNARPLGPCDIPPQALGPPGKAVSGGGSPAPHRDLSMSTKPTSIPPSLSHTHTRSSLISSTTLPLPSPSLLSLTAAIPTRPHTRPAPVLWTPALLSTFYTRFLLPLYRDGTQPFGALSIAVSGPKPDPFLALVPPNPLEAHLSVTPRAPPPALNAGTKHAAIVVSPRRSNDGFDARDSHDVHNGIDGSANLSACPEDEAVEADTNRPVPAPVRVEAGDHIRVYCNAKHALALRTWLYGIEVGSEVLDAGVGAAQSGITLDTATAIAAATATATAAAATTSAERGGGAGRAQVGAGVVRSKEAVSQKEPEEPGASKRDGAGLMTVVDLANEQPTQSTLYDPPPNAKPPIDAGSSAANVAPPPHERKRRRTKDAGSIKLFDRVRLALVGPRGEVLMVA